MAGGVALNCVGNGRILRESPFKNIWIQPAAGDAGGALGTALFIWHQLLGNAREICPEDSQQGSFLGPHYNETTSRQFFDSQQVPYHFLADEDELCEKVSSLLAEGKVVGWMQGRMEFGPRALGGRSILGDPRSRTMQSVMNRKIKFRESFRPFAPSVLCDKASSYFELQPDQESPNMLLGGPGSVGASHTTFRGGGCRGGTRKVEGLPKSNTGDYARRLFCSSTDGRSTAAWSVLQIAQNNLKQKADAPC